MLVINGKTEIIQIVPHICIPKICFIQDWCHKKCLLKLEGSLGKQKFTVWLKVVYQMMGQNSEGGAVLHAKIPYLGKENHGTAESERHVSRSLSPTTWFWIALRMDTPHPLWSTCWCFICCLGKEVFHMFKWSFLYFSLNPLSLVLSLDITEKRLALSSKPPSGMYTHCCMYVYALLATCLPSPS